MVIYSGERAELPIEKLGFTSSPDVGRLKFPAAQEFGSRFLLYLRAYSQFIYESTDRTLSLEE